MTFSVWGSLALTAVAVLLIPLLALTYRLVIRWTRSEDKLEQVVRDLDGLMRSKDETHRWLYDQMAKDRHVTDKRLRWLEQHLWREGKRQ